MIGIDGLALGGVDAGSAECTTTSNGAHVNDENKKCANGVYSNTKPDGTECK
jgi:hypothetical protein